MWIGALLSMPNAALSQDTFQVGNTTLTATDIASGIQLPWEILWGPDAVSYTHLTLPTKA